MGDRTTPRPKQPPVHAPRQGGTIGPYPSDRVKRPQPSPRGGFPGVLHQVPKTMPYSTRQPMSTRKKQR